MMYTKEFEGWWACQVHVEGLEGWQSHRVKAMCFRAWLRGRAKLREKTNGDESKGG